MYRNLSIFLKFWSSSGNWKSQKAQDFSTFKNFNTSFWLYVASQKKQRHNFRLAAAVVSKQFQCCPLKSLGSCSSLMYEEQER
jgi:hypothetical protein